MASIFIHGVSFFFFFFFFFFFLFFSVSLSDPRISEAGSICGTFKPPPKSRFIPTFIEEMEAISELLTTRNWTTHFVNSTPPMFALSQCFNDLSHNDCLLCYAASRTALPRCLPAVSARIFLDGCFLRYDNYSFYKESTDSLRDSVNCTSELGEIDESDKLGFGENVRVVVENVTRTAMANGGFGIGEVNGLFGLAQCWGSVEPEGCRACLEKARRSIRSCLPSREGRALNAGCYLRYSTVKFFNDKAEEQDHDDQNGFSGRRAVAAIVLASVASLIIAISAAFACYTRISNLKKEKKKQSLIPISFRDSDVNFKYETLEKATNYFSPSKNSTPLLQTVWDLYKSGRLSEAIDSCLNKDYPAKEAMDVLQIGLLCTQALASLRPSMATVVKLLSSEGERKVSIPEQPPFLNPCGASRRSCRVSSLVSKLEVSSGTSTDSETTSH
ncbi:Cysteine-rich receptor-like protein kinase 42, partial [Cucurbita argyrosperma subsp. sororia]